MQQHIETYQNRPTRAEVSLGRIRNNFEIVRSLAGRDVKIMAMVKSNAYGHGILTISRTLLDAGAHHLGVAYLEEALYLRKSGVIAPILVCGAINTDQIDDFIHHDIEITSSSLDKSAAISAAAVRLGKTAKVHLKIDTGMERIGVHWYNAERFIERTLELPSISVAGLFSTWPERNLTGSSPIPRSSVSQWRRISWRRKARFRRWSTWPIRPASSAARRRISPWCGPA